MKKMTKRDFIRSAVGLAGAAATGALAGCGDKRSPLDKGITIPQTAKMGRFLPQHTIDAIFNRVINR